MGELQAGGLRIVLASGKPCAYLTGLVPPEPAAELDRLNEAADQAIAVGDSENDIPMLGVVGFSICIGANPSCRAPASMS
ncbi:MAG: hypothetical protein FJX74_20550, partial [Armatimonadetes bacterium]|nr:hypothetical protein [Armatimonadota bacterium]